MNHKVFKICVVAGNGSRWSCYTPVFFSFSNNVTQNGTLKMENSGAYNVKNAHST